MVNNQKNLSKGFVFVATKFESFLKAGYFLAETILDYMPDAKITLFTEKLFLEDENLKTLFTPFDKILPTPGSTNREKMWGMANSPYDITMYLDVDMEVVHEDICTVFDQIQNYDMRFVNLTKEGARHFAEWSWGENTLDNGYTGSNPQHLTHCGGVCLYNNTNPLVKQFMIDWYSVYLKQRAAIELPIEIQEVPKSFWIWDQLTLWWLLWHSPKYKELKWKFFEENYRWNYYSSFGLPWTQPNIYASKHPIIHHYSSGMDKYSEKGIL